MPVGWEKQFFDEAREAKRESKFADEAREAARSDVNQAELSGLVSPFSGPSTRGVQWNF